ncbi:MAG: translocation/assembly module TamB domain-containing protein [Pseudomonadota bacterium]
MAINWSSARLWRRIVIAAVIALVLAMILLRLFAMTPMARSLVESRLEAMTIRGQTIELEGLEGDLLGRLTAENLRIRDADGIWLDADEIELSWAPLAYLSRHLKVRNVSAEALTLMRRPRLAPSSGGGAGPDRITLEALDVETVSLENGVAGPAQTYALAGSLRTERQTGGFDLNLSPKAPGGDRIQAALDWGGDVPLRGRMKISGAPSGLIATLVQAPAGDRISAELTAEGTLLEWTLVAEGQVGDEPALELNLSRAARRYTADGRIALDALGVFAPLQSRLGDSMDFTGSIDDNGDMRATLEADTLSGRATGQLSWRSDGVQIDNLNSQISRANAEAIIGLAGLDLPELALLGTLSLSREEQVFQGRTSVPRFAYDGYASLELEADGLVRLSGSGLDIDTEISASRVTGLPDSLATLISGPVSGNVIARYDRNTPQVQIAQSEFRTSASQGTMTGTFTPRGDVALAGTVSTRALDYVSNLNGSWSLTGPHVEDVQLKFDGQIEATQDSEWLTAIIGRSAEIDLTVRRDASALNLTSASLRTATLNATASAQLQDGRVSGQSQIQSAALSTDTAALRSALANLSLSGPVASPDVVLTAEIEALTYAEQSFTDLRIVSDASLGETNTLSATASAQYLDQPINLEASGRGNTETIFVDRLEANWDTLAAQGTGRLSLQSPQASELEIAISGRVANLGAIEADLTYEGEQLAGNVSLNEAVFGGVDIDQASANLSGNWPRFTGEMTYAARLETPGGRQTLKGLHGLHANLVTRQLELDGAATIANQTIAFASPLVVSLGDDFEATGQALAFGGQIDLALKPLLTETSTVRISSVSVQSLGPLLNRPALLGRLDADASIALVDGALSGSASGTISGLTRGVSNAPATDLVLDAAIVSDTLSATMRTEDGDQRLDFVAQAHAQLQHAGTIFSIRPIPGSAIPVSITGDGPIEPLWAIAAPTDLRVEGHARVDINNGSGETWRFQGPVQFEQGIFEDGITGIHLTDISIDAALQPDGIDIQAARAAGRRSGYVEASGSYKFDGSGSVSMTLNRLNALNRSDVSATLSGVAEVERQNRRTSISGDLEIDQARINLEKLPRAGYTTMEVVFVEDLDTIETDAPEREAIALQLNVSADRRIFVAGSGVDTEWGLVARVMGSPGRPNIIGRANLIRGEADLLSRRFRFSEGQVRLVGDPSDSQLLIRADRASDDVTSTIILSGSVTDPEITLSSDPALPNDEILSRVLFGRSPSELSPLQAAQLAGAAAQLAGGDALNLVGQLQEATGLDRLDIGLDDAGAATLSTGKYLSEDIYLEIESGGTGAPGVALEWTPLENVAIDAEIDPELGPKVAIQWKRDFDRLPGEPESE